MKISDLDREIINFIQGDIPLEPRPFLSLAQSLNLSEDEIITRIRHWQERGIIRRFATILAHYRAGFTANAMVAWKVEAEDADQVGMIMASYDQASHCYLRDVPEEFGYNFFTMIHAGSDEQMERLVEDMAWQTGVKDYIIIRSVRELKKVSMEYEL
ncbi:siroheme decarboxylase subunit beta [Syntrophomonas curvata]